MSEEIARKPYHVLTTKSGSRRDFIRTTALTALVGGAAAAGSEAMDKMHEAGVKASFHCHILPHAESDHGMFGMVTALVVT